MRQWAQGCIVSALFSRTCSITRYHEARRGKTDLYALYADERYQGITAHLLPLGFITRPSAGSCSLTLSKTTLKKEAKDQGDFKVSGSGFRGICFSYLFSLVILVIITPPRVR